MIAITRRGPRGAHNTELSSSAHFHDHVLIEMSEGVRSPITILSFRIKPPFYVVFSFHFLSLRTEDGINREITPDNFLLSCAWFASDPLVNWHCHLTVTPTRTARTSQQTTYGPPVDHMSHLQLYCSYICKWWENITVCH